MKSLINFLILILVVTALGFLGWSALNKTLFADAEDQIPPQEETGIPTNPQPKPEEPTAISSADAFGATSDSSPTTEMNFNCSEASKTIGDIYDMHIEGRSIDEISQSLAGLDKFNQADIDMFSQIAKHIKEAPSDQLLPRNEMIEQFKLQCDAAEASN